MSTKFDLTFSSLKRKVSALATRIAACKDNSRLALSDSQHVPVFMGQFRTLDRNFESFEALCNELTDLCEEQEPSQASKFPTSQDKALIQNTERYFDECNKNWFILDQREKAAAASSAALDSSRTRRSGQFNETMSPGPSNHLPKINLPSFDGNLLAWPKFKDVYVSLIHCDDNLTDIKKFHYLTTSVTGTAHSVISNLPLTADNYAVAWEALCAAFDNKRLLATTYLNEVLNFPRMTNKASVDSLKSFLSKVSESVSAFKLLKIEKESEFILYYLATRVLDAHTRELLEVQHKETPFPTFDMLTKFVRERVLALQLANPDAASGTSSTSVTSSKLSLRSSHKTSLLVNRAPLSSKSSLTHSRRPDVKSDEKCEVCEELHPLIRCVKFNQGSAQQRFDWLKKWKGCRNCLASGHQSKHCPSKWHCRLCSERHHTLLHLGKPETGDQVQTAQGGSQPAPPSSALNTISRDGGEVLLGTAVGEIQDSRGCFHPVRLVIDSGSQFSFISQRFMRKLGLSSFPAPKAIGAIGRSIFEGAKGKVLCTLRPANKVSPNVSTQAVVLKDIVCDLPNFNLPDGIWNRYIGYPLADPKFWETGPIDFLLGCDLYPDICEEGIISVQDGWPKLMASIFGYIVCGRLPKFCSSNSTAALLALPCLPSLQDQLHQFWEVEEPIGDLSGYTDEEERCVQHFKDNHYRTEMGQYVVRLPFKNDPVELGESFSLAKRRFFKLEEKLRKNSALQHQYFQFMQEYLDMGHMKPTTASSNFVIPHHSVVKEDRGKTKLRVVFDCSCATTLGSLNDQLMVGPKLQRDICHIIMNFRRHPIVFVADVVKMYRFILMDPRDRAFQHILWRFHPTDAIIKYELATLTYGLSPAPFLALSVMEQLCRDEGHNFPLAVEAVRHDMYIDDVATGAASIEDALELQQQLIGLLEKGGFSLSKWSSNHQSLLNSVNITNDQPIDLSSKEEHSIKILGLQWDPVRDCFSYHIQVPKLVFTKRSILSEVAKIYDPLGFISPVVVSAKSLIQDLWKAGVDWDQPIPSSVEGRWKLFVEQLPSLSAVRIPRFVLHTATHQLQLVGFCDASERAYSAAIYLRVATADSVRVHLITAKTKLAPVKTMSIPRLELCGAYLLVKTLSSISAFVSSLFADHHEPILFTDSTIVLSWISKPSYTLKTFVANRVSKIVEKAPFHWWRHIRTHDNPSDCNSRGMDPNELMDCSLWWSGPPWLLHPLEDWPNSYPVEELEDVPETKSTIDVLSQSLVTTTTEPPLLRWIAAFSSFMKMIRFFSHLRRWIVCRKGRKPFKFQPIIASELHDTQMCLIQFLQNNLLCGGSTSQSFLESKFSNLKPFLDPVGVIRVGGRISNANIPYAQKHPMLLPRCHFTNLLIDHYHHMYLHPGPGLLQALIQLRFWVPSLRKVIRHRNFLCIRCYKAKSERFELTPQMADLPKYRLEGGRAFLHVGVDFAGPYYIRYSLQRKSSVSKAYMCLYVCMVTKAVHLEAVTGLSTDAFLASFNRFISRRGLPEQIYSDCGTNFVGASNKLKELAIWFNQDTTKQAITQLSAARGVTWNFNPPGAPHFGGLWEAGVKSAKSAVSKTIGEAPLTYEELSTLFAQVEAILNSRPICPLSSSPDEVDFLSPGHFLVGDHLLRPPEPTLLDIKESLLSRWQLIQRMSQHVWKRWRQEYLCTLQQRVKWRKPSYNIQINDLVLLKDPSSKPLDWLLAKVIKTHPGKDGTVRVVTLRTPSTMLTRPVVKLVPLLPLNVEPYDEP